MFAALLSAQLLLASPAAIDGDTIHEKVRTQDYRVYGIDAPEMTRVKCPAEKVAGAAAKARVVELLAGASEVRAFPAWDPRGRKEWPTDGFGRRIARIEIDGRDLAGILLYEGLALPWDGDGPHPDWCAWLAARRTPE